MSRHNDKKSPTLSPEDESVAEHRSEKYRERIAGVGRRIRFAREEAGWSVRELAEKSGVDKGQISRLENGDNLEISVGRYMDLCEALSLDPVYVWTGKTRGRHGRRDEPPSDPSPAPPATRPSEPPPASVQRPSSRPGRR